MNKNNRKNKRIYKRILALMLCCFCLLATVPISSFALETGKTQITEESISEQQSGSSSESLPSLSSETSESQTETDTQQSTSDEMIEPIIENETDAEVETEVTSETGTEAGAETETELEADGETGGETSEEAGDEGDTVVEPKVEKPPMDLLFDRLMACETMEEMTAVQQAMTLEEWELAAQFTDEQNYALSVKMNELGAYATDSLEENNGATEINPDLPFIRVKKVIQGISEDKIPPDFYDEFEVYVNSNGVKMTSGTEATWDFFNLEDGTYNIKEKGAEIEGYDLSVAVDGVTLTPEQQNSGIEVDVKAADALVSKITDGTSQGGGTTYPVKPGTMFVGHNSNDKSVIIISHSPIELSIRQAVEAELKTLNGWSNNPTFTYYNLSRYENGAHLSAGSISFTYDGDSITFDAQSNYNKYATTVLTVSEAENASITITNTYTPNTRNLTVQKTLSGNMYDANKKFAFTVTVNNVNTTFDLAKDETHTIENVPVGAVVSVTENPDGYTYSFVSITEGVEKMDKKYGVSFIMPAQDVTVVINNDKTVTIDTGILLDTLPYILILGVVAVGAVLLIKKRRNRDDD